MGLINTTNENKPFRSDRPKAYLVPAKGQKDGQQLVVQGKLQNTIYPTKGSANLALQRALNSLRSKGA